MVLEWKAINLFKILSGNYILNSDGRKFKKEQKLLFEQRECPQLNADDIISIAFK
jgi:hypothetical protein